MSTDPLDAIQARLTAAEAGGYRSFPWRPIINTAGDRHGVVDGDGCIVTTGDKAVAELLAHAPIDIAALVKALRAVEAVHAIKYYDKWGRTSSTYSPDGQGGWCDSCGRIDGEKCKTITAIREALNG